MTKRRNTEVRIAFYLLLALILSCALSFCLAKGARSFGKGRAPHVKSHAYRLSGGCYGPG